MIAEMVKDRDGVNARVSEAVEKAHALQDSLNAVITFVDPAKQLEEMPEEGLLRGVPIALKDNVNTKGVLSHLSMYMHIHKRSSDNSRFQNSFQLRSGL